MNNYMLNLSPDNSYILCTVNSPFSVDDSEKFVQQVNRLSESENIGKLLFDFRKAPVVSDISRQNLFARTALSRMNLRKDVNVAVVIDPTDRSHDLMEHLLQREGVNMRIFEDIDRAIKWLNR